MELHLDFHHPLGPEMDYKAYLINVRIVCLQLRLHLIWSSISTKIIQNPKKPANDPFLTNFQSTFLWEFQDNKSVKTKKILQLVFGMDWEIFTNLENNFKNQDTLK